MDKDQWLTTRDVAKVIDVQPETIAEWCRTGEIEAEKVFGSWAIHEESLETFRKKRKKKKPKSKRPKTVHRTSFVVSPEKKRPKKASPSRKEEIHARADAMVEARRRFLRKKFPHPKPGEVFTYVLEQMAPQGVTKFDPAGYEDEG